MSAKTAEKASVSKHDPWIFRSVLSKDAKFKVQERYWRSLLDVAATTPKQATDAETTQYHSYNLIPDGVTWRKYLKLIQKILEINKVPFRWYLLESAVEYMDYRNQSPCMRITADSVDDNDNDVNTEKKEDLCSCEWVREKSSPQERASLYRLVQQRPQRPDQQCLVPFCDLSVRDGGGGGGGDLEEDSEWNWMGYETMGIHERSRHAHIRAGRMVQQLTGNRNISNSYTNGNENYEASPPVVWLLVSDDQYGQQPQNRDEQIHLDEGVNFVNDFTQIFHHLEQKQWATPDQLETLTQLKLACEEDYIKRNILSPNASSSTTTTSVEADTPQEYLSPADIQKGIQNGQLLRGRLEVTKENFREGYVSAEGTSYFVDQLQGHFNRAFHQDLVVFRVLPEYQWGRPVGKRRLVYFKEEEEDPSSEATNEKNNVSIPLVPSAIVVGISEPGRRVFVATMVYECVHDESAILVVPMDVRIPKIRIRTRQWRSFLQKRLLVEVDRWDVGSNYPSGRCVKIIGPVGDLEVEIECLLHENQVYLDPFSLSARACLPPEGEHWTIPAEEILVRRDLRTSRRVFSVDPPGCQDIDDTMHAEVLRNGDLEVGVHIADVTYFVPHNSALDKEAQARGTTFYLVDRRFDMLPSLLSSDLCSLHGDTDRLAVSVIWTLSSDFKTVKNCWFGRTVIHNCAAMTYSQADNILRDKPPEEQGKKTPPPLTAGKPVNQTLVGALKKDLTILTNLARFLRKRREDIGGAVDLSSGDSGSELKFTLESGKPVKVVPKQDKEIHHTIAELMIMANTSVASKIFEIYPDSALLRVHRFVEEERFEDLKGVLKAGGIAFDGKNNKALAATLKKAESTTTGGAAVNSLFKSLATRAMSEAQYVSTGDRNQNLELSHYGLGLEVYTHFTSPIRRYADVIVHKQLLASIIDGRRDGPGLVDHSKKERSVLESVPDSRVISILGGEGLKENADVGNDDFLDSIIEGASELLLGSDSTPDGGTVADEFDSSRKEAAAPLRPYTSLEVSRICEGLNLHNRLAKHSSYECQSLFLSLYFRNHAEITDAVVINLRMNGFWVYVPKFDLRGPVYLKDMNGNLQIEPSFVGLPPDSGLPPTLGDASSDSKCKRFPSGKCELFDEPDERLEVAVVGGKKNFVVRPLSVVSVQITCEGWDVRARVPSPRIQLVAGQEDVSYKCQSTGKPGSIVEMTSKMFDEKRPNKPVPKFDESNESSLFDQLASLQIFPILENVLVRRRKQRSLTKVQEGFLQGRFVFENFVNPDTRSAAQDAAQQAAATAASDRRVAILEQRAYHNENATRNIERSVMGRQLRLDAGKRNARRSKAK